MRCPVTYAARSRYRTGFDLRRDPDPAADPPGAREDPGLLLACARERPVRFSGRVLRHVTSLRLALATLGRIAGGQEARGPAHDPQGAPHPLITVHPDRILLEAFSPDLRFYGQVTVEPGTLEPSGEITCGTSPFDLSPGFLQAVDTMRSHPRPWLQVAPDDPDRPQDGAPLSCHRDLPDFQVRGLLRMLAALALPGIRLELRPVDLLAAHAFLQRNNTPVPPGREAWRYDLSPGEPACLVLEPWEERVSLPGAVHASNERRVIHGGSREALALLAPLLPHAQRTELYLKCGELPVFHRIVLPGVSILLGVNSPSAGDPGSLAGLGLDLPRPNIEDPVRVLAPLAAARHLPIDELARRAGLPAADTTRLLTGLTAAGRVLPDLSTHGWRHRELFDPPLRRDSLDPPDPRVSQVHSLLQSGISGLEVLIEEDRYLIRALQPGGQEIERETAVRQWRVEGACGEERPQILAGAGGKILSGHCGCAVFRERGPLWPCAHMLTLLLASAPLREPKGGARLTSSVPVSDSFTQPAAGGS